jgi:ubiquinone/menaquinone biosynthesis C-methylase UbiE
MYDPERYETYKSAPAKDAEEFVPILIKGMKGWKENETILDYGCGAGSVANKHLVPLATKYNATIHAVDISNEMIKHAKEAYPHPSVHYLQGDIQDPNFPLLNKQFDQIFSIYVLHFIRDYR